MGMRTLVSEAPLSMHLVPAKLHCLQMPRARIPRNKTCQMHSTIRWCYRRQLTRRNINLWRRLARATIRYPTAQMLYLAFQSMETCVDSAPVASGETPDDVECSLRSFVCF